MNKKATVPKTVTLDGDFGHAARLADNTLVSMHAERFADANARIEADNPEQGVYIRHSSDNGLTWTEAAQVFSYRPGTGVSGSPFPLVSPDGVLHALAVRFFKAAGNWDPESASHSEVKHYSSGDGGRTWTGPHDVDFGKSYTGALNSAIALTTGRLVLALSCPSDAQQGRYVCVSTVSDDGGKTWQPGGQELIVPDGDQPGHPGALEPVLLELLDGRVWMVIRTQTGYFYESFSSDEGASWSEPQKTSFQAPNAPGAICRLDSGDVILCWNDLNRYPAGASGNRRQFLHIALSRDDGKTFSPSVEIARRREGEFEDTNVAYPFLCPTSDGEVFVVYHRVGSQEGVTWWTPIVEVLKVNPQWILAGGKG